MEFDITGPAVFDIAAAASVPVVNVGVAASAAGLVIAQGASGLPGAPGPPGATGAPGADGSGVIPRDSNHRQAGIGIYTDGTGYRAIDSFTVE
jgi:hypothetical protein